VSRWSDPLPLSPKRDVINEWPLTNIAASAAVHVRMQ